MAELERKDLISDEALKAPAILTKEFEKLLEVVTKVKTNAKELGTQITASDSTGKVAKSTQQLTTEEKELIKVQNQISTALAKTSQEYQDYKAGLEAINKATKDGQVLGNKKAEQVTKENSSLKQLEVALDKNRAAYANLRNEHARNSEQGKKLLAVIQEQDKGVNELRKSIGKFTVEAHDNEKAVETLKDRLKEAGNEFGGASSKIDTVVGLFKELAQSKVALGLGAIGLAVAGVTKAVFTYFETTVSGHEFIALIEGRIEGYKGYLTKRLAEVGKDILESDVLKRIQTTFKNLLPPSVDQEGKPHGQTLDEIIAGQLEKGRTYTSEEYRKIREDAKATYEEQRTELQKAGDAGEELAVEELQHIKDVSKAIVDKANNELETNEALEKSRDKLQFSDEQRLGFLKLAKAKRAETLEVEIELAEKEKEHMIRNAQLLSDEPRIGRARAEATAKIINLQAEFLAGNRRIDNQISTVEQEVLKRELTNVRIAEDAKDKAGKDEIDASIKRAEEELRLETVSGQERVTLVYQLGEDRIKALEFEKQKEINVIKRAAQDRLVEEGGKDFSDTAVNALRSVQEQKLNIEKEYASKEIELNKKTQAEINTAVLDDFHKDLAKRKVALSKGQEELVEIDRKYANGEIIGYEIYLKTRRQTEIKYAKLTNEFALQSLQEELEIRRAQGLLTVEQEQKIQDTILTIKENAYRKDIEGRRRTQEAIQQLEQQVFATSLAAVEAHFDKQEESLQKSIDERIKKLERQKDIEITIAGDNAEAKIGIEERYKAKEDAIQAEQNALRRKRAAAEQKLAAFEIVIRTAASVLKAYAEVPYPYDTVVAAAYAAIGALQLATVLTKPLPAFELGTDNAPGGLAVVGEKGVEKIIEPDNKVWYTPDRPTVVPIKKGSVVIPNNELMREVAQSALRYETGPLQPIGDTRALKKLSDIEAAILNKERPVVNITREGLKLMVAKAQETIIFLDQFYK